MKVNFAIIAERSSPMLLKPGEVVLPHRYFTGLGILVMILVVVCLSGAARAADPAGHKITFIDRQTGRSMPTSPIDIGDNIGKGDQITVYETSGRVLELIVEEVATSDQPGLDTSLAGSYISDITDNDKRYFQEKNLRELVVRFEQTGERITGNVSSLTDGYIEGTRRGDRIKFFFYSPAISIYEISGEWKLSADGYRLEGSWKHPVNFSSGKWNLTRTDPVVATRRADSPMIKGRLVADQTAVAIRLAEVDKIETRQAVSTSEDSTASACRMNQAARDAIVAAEEARPPGPDNYYRFRELIRQAEAAAGPPECDSGKAIILAQKAERLAGDSIEAAPSPTPTATSSPGAKGFGEFNLSHVAFDDNTISGSTFLWGLSFGGSFATHYEMAYSYNDILPLISPELDKPAELDTGEFLHVNMQMLSLRRNWQINDATTAFVLVGYSKINIEIDKSSLCVLCGFTISSKNTYRNKLSGPAWGVGMQWKTSNNGYRSLKYMDHSQSGFGFSGVHLNFGWDFDK